MARHAPWLARTAPRRMAALIRHHLTGEHPWTPAELATEMARIKPFPPDTAHVWAPLSLLKWYLRHIPADQSPAWNAWHNQGLRESAARQRQEQAAATAARRAEEAAILAGKDPERRAQISAELRATLDAVRASRTPAPAAPAILDPGPAAWRYQ